MIATVVEYKWHENQEEYRGRPAVHFGDRVYAIKEQTTGDLFKYSYVLESDALSVIKNLEYSVMRPGSTAWNKSWAGSPSTPLSSQGNPMLRDNVINAPVGTRLYAVVTWEHETHVWIAIAKRSETYEDWRGTYIRFEPDGTVTRVTADDNYPTDDIMVIRKGEKK